MLRKTMVALFALASAAMLIPDAASARGGFGGGGGGFHGGGGFGGGFHGGGFRGGGMGMGGGGFRAAGIGGGGFPRPDRGRRFPSSGVAGRWISRRRCRNGFHGGYHRGFPHRRFPFGAAAVGVGFGYGYYNGYYDYGYPYYGSYDDSYYYGDSGCYIVRRSVLTPYGWRIRPVQVCG